MRRTLPPAVMAVLHEQPPAAPAPAVVTAPLDFEGTEADEMQPVGDPETRSWETPSTALVYVTECPGSALVIADDGQLHLERWRENYCGAEAVFIDVDGADPSAVPWGLAIWVGKMHTTETHTPDCHEFDTDMRGTLRALTDTEWANMRAGRPPWETGLLFPAEVK